MGENVLVVPDTITQQGLWKVNEKDEIAGT
jgi:hypothetical protein